MLSRLLVIAIVAGSTLVFNIAPALAAPPVCPSNDPAHPFSQQYDPRLTDDFDIQYGTYFTYAPYVNNIATMFSLNHLYMQNSYGSTKFIEVGWYKGLGNYNTNLPRFYRVASDDVHGYQEYDFTNPGQPVPTVGDYYNYELKYVGHDYTYDEARWDIYFDNFTTPKSVVLIKGLDGGLPLAGGEVRGTDGSGTHMIADGSNMKVAPHGGALSNWTTAVYTSLCADSGFTYAATTPYTHFTVDGTQ